MPVSGHLTLECLADSDPAPDIEWYKDEAKLQVELEKNKTGIELETISSDSHTVSFSYLPPVISAGWSYPAAGRGSVPGDSGSQA